MAAPGLLAQDAQFPLLQPGWGAVVFNEVMADPHPPVRWEEEYLELYNRSGREVDLEAWVLYVNHRSYVLAEKYMPEGSLLAPGSFGLVRNINLPNDGAMLCLYDTAGNLVHAANYGIPWDGMDWKKEGGWSLESPDPEQLCTLSERWEYSENPDGGTPGRTNSRNAILEDHESPVLLYAGFADVKDDDLGDGSSGLIRLYFSEPILISSSELHEIVLFPGKLGPVEAKLTGPLFQVLELRFPSDLQERSHFRVRIPPVGDCQGNESLALEAEAGSVELPASGSIHINEIMYDPEEGKPEFIELYPAGNHYHDLRDLAIHVEQRDDPPGHPVPLSDHSRLMIPGSYLVLSSCEEHLREAYHLDRSGRWVEVEELGKLPNGGGTLYLTDRAGNVVDRADYGDEMHAKILSDTRGISLERISPDGAGSDPDNWHSAASLRGFCTPGMENSQVLGQTESSHWLELDPRVFSPDNDGYQDLLEVLFSFGEPGWVVSIRITDLRGNFVRTLANNQLCGPGIRFSWDGCGEDGNLLPSGLYVVHAWAYHPPSGKKWIRKQAAGLVYR